MDYEQIDPSAETFRFPRNNKGERHLSDQQRINFLDVVKRFEKTSLELDSLNAYCTQIIDSVTQKD